MVTAGVTSTGGITTLVVSRLLNKNNRNKSMASGILVIYSSEAPR